MNGAFVYLHGLVRWFVIAGGIYAVARAALARDEFGDAQERSSIPFMIALDLQFLLGVAMYLATSPVAHAARVAMPASMKDDVMRFWAIEHPFAMIVAFVVMHVGRVLMRKAREDDVKRRRALWSLGFALVVVLLGTPWPFMPYGRPLLPHM